MPMKRLLIVVLLLTSFAVAQSAPPQASQPATQSSQAQPAPPAAKPEDVKSMDSIMAAVYDVISGPAGQKRDWDRFRSLFIPGARLIPVSKRPEATVYTARVLSPEDYVSRASTGFAQQAFYEKEVARRVEQWGNIAQAFSTYESRRAPGDQPFARGINSFQLLNDGQRWWIVTIYWEAESKDVPLPPEMLKSK
jgi:hypothetical protein